MSDLGQADKMLEETEPNKLREMPTEKVIEYEHNFAQQLPSFGMGTRDQQIQRLCQARMELLRQVIQERRIEERSERQHQASYKIEKRILFWAIIGGVTGMLILVAEYVPLIRDTFFSKAQPSTLPQAPPRSSLQSPTPTSVSPEPEASSSTAMPSPEQAATVQPSVSPLESSD